jgi:hypothetical protein
LAIVRRSIADVACAAAMKFLPFAFSFLKCGCFLTRLRHACEEANWNWR